MPLTPSRGTRAPLRPVTNTAASPLHGSGSTPVKNSPAKPPAHPQKKAALPRLSLPPLPQTNRDGAMQKLKKPRPMNKRVSFGGNSINFYNAHPEHSSPESEPSAKVHKTGVTSSPSLRQSPLFSKSAAAALSDDEDSNDDTVNMPQAPNVNASCPSPVQAPSPLNDENASPVPVRRDSLAYNDRQSFGVFVDEDVTMGERDVSMATHDDTTQVLPRISSVLRSRRESMMSVASDGDITQPLIGFFPSLLEADEAQPEPSTDTIGDSAPASGDEPDSSEQRPAHGKDGQHVDPSQELSSHVLERSDIAGIDGFMGHELSSLKQPTDEDRVAEAFDGDGPGNQDSVAIGNLSAAAPASRTDKAQSASPALSKQARAVPPNRRKLFDTDSNEDEDTTLHYHTEESSLPNQGTSSTARSTSQRQPLGVLSDRPVVPSTPKSATGSKVRSAIEERASASGKRNAASQLRELSSSVLRSSQNEGAAAEQEVSLELNFHFSDFLHAVQLNFDKKAETMQRAPSLAIPIQVSGGFDRTSFEGEVSEVLLKTNILDRLNDQIHRLKTTIANDEANIETLGDRIEATSPPLFARMSNYESMPIHEMTTCRVSMKRLRKLSTLKAKAEWVSGRHEWETGMSDQLVKTTVALRKDIGTLRQSKNDHEVIVSPFVSKIAELGLSSVFQDERRDEEIDEENVMQRRAVIQELSLFRDMREYAISQGNDEHDLSRRKSSLVPKRSSLSTLWKDLQRYAGANNSRSVKKMVRERAELNSIISGVSGVKLLRMNKNSIALRAVDMMDVQFSLHDDRVINVSCTPVKFSQTPSCTNWQPYVDGAVSMLNMNGSVKAARYVHDIPCLLHRATSLLRLAKTTYEDAANYFDKHLGSVLSGSLNQGGALPSLDLTVQASFYSIRERSKFDMEVVVSILLPRESSEYPRHVVRMQNITRFFGTAPEDERVTEVLTRHGSKSATTFSLSEGLTAVWDTLR